MSKSLGEVCSTYEKYNIEYVLGVVGRRQLEVDVGLLTMSKSVIRTARALTAHCFRTQIRPAAAPCPLYSRAQPLGYREGWVADPHLRVGG